MTNLNSIIIAGNVTADPHVVTNAQNKTSVLFTVAVNAGKEHTDFIPVRLNGGMFSEYAKNNLKKGAAVIITGRIENRTYEKDGTKKNFFCIAPSVLTIGPRGSMNVATLMGNLTADPEIRLTSADKKVASFSIANNQSYKAENGEWKDLPVSYIDITVWEKQCEFVEKYFHKGDPIMLNGHIQSRQYETKDGDKRTKYCVVASSVSFASSKKKDDETPVAKPVAPTGTTYSAGAYDDFAEIGDDEDLPF